MRKPAFCICENKVADQLRGHREADQRLCFCYMDSTIPLLPKSNFQVSRLLCGCTARFVLDLVGNPEDRFSHNEAQIFWFAVYRPTHFNFLFIFITILLENSVFFWNMEQKKNSYLPTQPEKFGWVNSKQIFKVGLNVHS